MGAAVLAMVALGLEVLEPGAAVGARKARREVGDGRAFGKALDRHGARGEVLHARARKGVVEAADQLVVGREAHLVPAPEPVQNGHAAEHQGGNRGVDEVAVGREVRQRQVVAQPHLLARAGHEVGAARQVARLDLDPRRVRPVVGVLQRDEGALRDRQRAVARRVGADVAIERQHAHARVLGREALGHGAGAVGAGVVDDDDLVLAPALLAHRLQRRGQRPLGVEGRDDDAHQGTARHGPGRPGRAQPVVERGALLGRAQGDVGQAKGAHHLVEPGDPRALLGLQHRARQRQRRRGGPRGARLVEDPPSLPVAPQRMQAGEPHHGDPVRRVVARGRPRHLGREVEPAQRLGRVGAVLAAQVPAAELEGRALARLRLHPRRGGRPLQAPQRRLGETQAEELGAHRFHAPARAVLSARPRRAALVAAVAQVVDERVDPRLLHVGVRLRVLARREPGAGVVAGRRAHRQVVLGGGRARGDLGMAPGVPFGVEELGGLQEHRVGGGVAGGRAHGQRRAPLGAPEELVVDERIPARSRHVGVGQVVAAGVEARPRVASLHGAVVEVVRGQPGRVVAREQAPPEGRDVAVALAVPVGVEQRRGADRGDLAPGGGLAHARAQVPEGAATRAPRGELGGEQRGADLRPRIDAQRRPRPLAPRLVALAPRGLRGRVGLGARGAFAHDRGLGLGQAPLGLGAARLLAPREGLGLRPRLPGLLHGLPKRVASFAGEAVVELQRAEPLAGRAQRLVALPERRQRVGRHALGRLDRLGERLRPRAARRPRTGPNLAQSLEQEGGAATRLGVSEDARQARGRLGAGGGDVEAPGVIHAQHGPMRPRRAGARAEAQNDAAGGKHGRPAIVHHACEAVGRGGQHAQQIDGPAVEAVGLLGGGRPHAVPGRGRLGVPGVIGAERGGRAGRGVGVDPGLEAQPLGRLAQRVAGHPVAQAEERDPARSRGPHQPEQERDVGELQGRPPVARTPQGGERIAVLGRGEHRVQQRRGAAGPGGGTGLGLRVGAVTLPCRARRNGRCRPGGGSAGDPAVVPRGVGGVVGPPVVRGGGPLRIAVARRGCGSHRGSAPPGRCEGRAAFPARFGLDRAGQLGEPARARRIGLGPCGVAQPPDDPRLRPAVDRHDALEGKGLLGQARQLAALHPLVVVARQHQPVGVAQPQQVVAAVVDALGQLRVHG